MWPTRNEETEAHQKLTVPTREYQSTTHFANGECRTDSDRYTVGPHLPNGQPPPFIRSMKNGRRQPTPAIYSEADTVLAGVGQVGCRLVVAVVIPHAIKQVLQVMRVHLSLEERRLGPGYVHLGLYLV